MGDSIAIRPLCAGDHAAVAQIFFRAVHEGTSSAYTLEQRLAWAGPAPDPERWRSRLAALTGFVAETGGGPVGFIAIDGTGHVDLAFVLPSASRSGVGGRLLHAAEDRARAQGTLRMTTEASLIAEPFFRKHGWFVVEGEEVIRDGVSLRRFRMAKDLS
ncbi:GNAT family N-acetyltransferase [Neotabrizicola sp. VNH66]|uniref:GNAT family N-acetyltransferase n=1 Tax=Neotabrizicola sp. VNH66 TaxID=3400918 RepID=UPI003C072B84